MATAREGTRVAPSAEPSAVFKTDAQRAFCLSFDKKLRGRYLAVVETSIGILGGEALRAKARDALGHALDPKEMYPVSDWVKLVVVAAEGGVSPRRLGALFFPKFRQTHPELFPARRVTMREALSIIERAAREETTYGGAPYTMHPLGPDKLRVVRAVNPLPCEFFAGILVGTLDALGYKGTVAETRCQWLAAGGACEFEAALSVPMPL